MLPVHITDKLTNYFLKKEFAIVEKEGDIMLQEKNREGKVELCCTLNGDSIIIYKPEQKVLPYLDDQIHGATSCADAFIFKKQRDSEKFDLHMFEFKRCVDITKYSKIKHQFTMGIYNARAIAGFLGMELEEVFLYIGLRKDKIIPKADASLISLRAANTAKEISKILEWKKNTCMLEIDNKWKNMCCKKIWLNEDGFGKIEI